MPNGNKLGSEARLNGGMLIDRHNDFLQEQLLEAQQALFFAKSVKEAKFLQNRINYLKGLVKGLNKNKLLYDKR